MIFSSYHFLVLYPYFLLTYYLYSNKNYQNFLLILFSIYFISYLHYKHFLVFLFFFVIFLFTVRLLHFLKNKVLIFGVSLIVITFLFFKTYSIFGLTKINLIIKDYYLFFPLAISFYVFQMIGGLIDTSRGDNTKTFSFKDYLLFFIFFPQLVAGPICRIKNLIPQFLVNRKLNKRNIFVGTNLILIGLFKKICIADNLHLFTDEVWSSPEQFSSSTVRLALFAYYIQFYADFSGYTDIGRGIARQLGIKIPINFTNPYFANNAVDFFKRWHISLSLWIRDYLFNPAYVFMLRKFNSHHKIIFLILSFLTLFIFGIWHGNSPRIIIYGLIWGWMLLSWHLFIYRLHKFSTIGKILSFIWTQGFFIFSLIFLKLYTFEEIGIFLNALVSNGKGISLDNFLLVFGSALIIYIFQFLDSNYDKKIIFNIIRYSRNSIISFLISLILFFGVFFYKSKFVGIENIRHEDKEISFTYFEY